MTIGNWRQWKLQNAAWGHDMHTEKDYAKLPNPEEVAIKDLKNWYGTRKFNELTGQLRWVEDFDYFANLVSLSGVSGYPVRVWWRYINDEST